jgi:hypothetical protein
MTLKTHTAKWPWHVAHTGEKTMKLMTILVGKHEISYISVQMGGRTEKQILRFWNNKLTYRNLTLCSQTRYISLESLTGSCLIFDWCILLRYYQWNNNKHLCSQLCSRVLYCGMCLILLHVSAHMGHLQVSRIKMLKDCCMQFCRIRYHYIPIKAIYLK